MNKDQELENYLSISKNKFGIYLFDVKNLKNLYKEELIINKNVNFIDLNELKKFLDNNIFKIEKLSGKFVENISLIFEDEKNLDIEVGIKKKNYNTSNTKECLEKFVNIVNFMSELVDPKDPKNNQFSERGLYVNDDDQDWGSAGMNDVQEDSE